MKRKILILASWYPSELSSLSGIFVQDQAELLSKEYDVLVLAPFFVGWRQILRIHLGPRWSASEPTGVKVYRQGVVVIPHMPVLAYKNYAKAARKGFNELIEKWGKPDIIHAHVVLPGGWTAIELAKDYSIPVVLTEHSSPFSMHLGTPSRRHLVRETLTQINHIIAVSPALMQQVQTFHQVGASSVIGNLIKTEFFVPIKNKKEGVSEPIIRFLCVALLSSQKGLSYLLKAAQFLIQRKITSFELIIGGDGPDRVALEQIAQAMGVADHCHFLGLLTATEVRHWMQQCDVFVLPSLHETFGIVLGEAMACGKPVISTRCGGPEFVVTPETGVLVEPANSEALAEAMEGFISGKFTYNPRVVRQSVTERFGETAFLRNVTTVYEQLWSKT
jgi:glycosyltransferase involved in cell wall biosynthesis